MATTHHEHVSLIGHDCPASGQILCFRVECRHCGAVLAEHAPLEAIQVEVRTLINEHGCPVAVAERAKVFTSFRESELL